MSINFFVLGKLYENNKNLKFYASSELSFPVKDIASYDEETGRVELRFMGLRGVDSPLPYYLSSYAELLQPLSHYLYLLFYQALNKKYQFLSYMDYFQACKKYSRENVIKIFSEKFNKINYEVKEFFPQWIALDQNSQKLGEIVLGQRIVVSTVKVIIPRYEDHVVIGQWIMH